MLFTIRCFLIIATLITQSWAMDESSSVVCKEAFVKVHKEVNLWTESFGISENPSILLIMGAGTSGIFWPDSLCTQLAHQGYFVIRYDHRDVGQSSLIDYTQHPYNLDDLALDALAILNSYGISKAHIVGLSMGGFVAQILASQYSDRVHSLVSIASSPDHSVMLAALAGENTDNFVLPPPPQIALEIWASMKTRRCETKEERLALSLQNWKLCAGEYGYDEDEAKALEERNFTRCRSFEAPFNHWKAMASLPDRTELLSKITVPTLVIHGELDVVLPVQHGSATAQAIPDATLKIFPEMGHTIGIKFSERIGAAIIAHIGY